MVKKALNPSQFFVEPIHRTYLDAGTVYVNIPMQTSFLELIPLVCRPKKPSLESALVPKEIF